MELPARARDDRNIASGRYGELERSLRRRVSSAEIPVLFIYAFDRRTRLGPFLYVDRSLIPGAVRAVGAALYAAGFRNTRVVMQQWNPRIRPSRARINGRIPEVLMVSAMQIHSAPAYRLIRDAWLLGEQRPLILAGGPKAIYEPWDFFGLSPDGREGVDVAVTGEEYVILELLERIVEHKLPGESMRRAFERVRAGNLLSDIPGLVYAPEQTAGPPEYLVNTGVQRLMENLDELPLPFDVLGLFERPHQGATLAACSLPAEQLGKHATIMSMIATRGCKFHCPYCPIPAYNQFSFRHRGSERLVEEMAGIAARSGIRRFFGTDDNFFNDRSTVEETFQAMARGQVHGKPFRKAITFSTEATEIDVFKNRDLLPLGREGGLRAIWFGIEDLTAGLVKKGQSAQKTLEVFKLLLKQGIAPMPMMMYHDGQPLWSWRNLYGLMNQVLFLWRAGAVTCQVTLLTPSVGSRCYEQAFDQGLVLDSVAGRPVEEYQYDGNHCVATGHDYPWRRQLNMLLGYASFYNPLNMLRSLPRFDRLWAERMLMQMYGMAGLARSVYNFRGWLRRLVSGPVERLQTLPRPRFRMVVPQGVEARLAHYGLALPIQGPTCDPNQS